jgi:hypothetical protein
MFDLQVLAYKAEIVSLGDHLVLPNWAARYELQVAQEGTQDLFAWTRAARRSQASGSTRSTPTRPWVPVPAGRDSLSGLAAQSDVSAAVRG